MDTRKAKSGKKAIGIAMVAIITASIFATLTPALGFHNVPVPPGDEGIYFLDPPISRVPGYCNSITIDVWVNSSIPIRGGSVLISTSDKACGNITGCTGNSTEWAGGLSEAGVIFESGKSARISFNVDMADTKQPGNYHAGTITVHCNSSTDCCLANLNIIPEKPNSYITNTTGTDYGVTGENGTFVCGDLINVTKTVKNPETGEWVEGYSFPMGTAQPGVNVTFNTTINAKCCCNLTTITVTDVMDESLTYVNGSATVNGQPCEPQVNGQTLTWSFDKLDSCNEKYIEFNATVNRWGKDYNTVTATGWCNETALSVPVSDTDEAWVNLPSPARIEVIKTIKEPATGDWVKVIQNASISDIYRINCTIHNAGSTGLNLEDIRVSDIMSSSLEYADNATMKTPDGITRSLEPPTYLSPDKRMINWTVNNYLQSNLTLQPCQSIEIQFDVHVVNYGNDSNTQCAKGWYAGEGKWIEVCDQAWIDVPPPDLIVSEITINYDAPSVKDKAIGPLPPGTKTQCNNLSANISELNGVNVKFPFKVKFEVNGAELNCSPVQVPAGMAGGSTRTVYCNCSFYPIAEQIYNISVIADSTNAIIESDETNNTAWKNVTAQWIGFKGDGWQDGRNITTLQCHEQDTINITYSTGDSKYLSGSANPNWTTYTVNWTTSDLPLPPVDTCIKKARLYVYYTWDTTPGRNISDYFTLKFNGYEVPKDKVYTDARFAGQSYNWGMVAYNVTDKFIATSGNKAVLTNSYPGGGKVSMEGMFLVVVYNNPNEPERIIMMNEGLDTLWANEAYGVSTEEATTYAPFTCPEIPLNMIVKAKLATVTVDAGSSGAVTDPHWQALYFNDILLGKGNQTWPVEYSIPTVNETDVLPYLKATNNTAAIQSYKPDGATHGDSFEASLAFLVVEKGWSEIAVEVPSECIAQGEQFTVNVTVNPRGIPIYGVEYEVSFNPSVIHAEWQNEGEFLNQDGASTNVYINTIDNSAGTIKFAVTRTGTTTGVTTPGVLARIHFTAVKIGANTTLAFTKVKVSDPDANEVFAKSLNGTVYVCKNKPPVAKAKSLFTYNNVGTKYISKTYFDGSASYDPDGNITNYRWALGDGNYGTGKKYEHVYGSWKWNGASYSYNPFEVILTVEDSGTPVMSNSTMIPVNVYIAGDANGDGIVDIFDGVIVGLEWDKTANFNVIYWFDNPRGDKADLNNDKIVDIFDGVIVGANWDHVAW